MKVIGVDVSHWESTINWELALPAIGFAYYKATDGIYGVDSQFLNNKTGCNKYGIPHAPYHWFQETMESKGQAEHFINTVGTGYKRYIVDVEPRQYVSDIVSKLRLLLLRIEVLTGIRPAIYTSSYYWNEFIRPTPSWAKDYDLLVAHYTAAHSPILPIGWNAYKIWQFTDQYWFFGCDEIGDGNWYNGTLQECRNWFGNYRPYSLPSTLKFKSLYNGLRIRSAPNINADIVGSLNAGDTVEGKNINGQDAWIEHEQGFTAKERYGVEFMEVV